MAGSGDIHNLHKHDQAKCCEETTLKYDNELHKSWHPAAVLTNGESVVLGKEFAENHSPDDDVKD